MLGASFTDFAARPGRFIELLAFVAAAFDARFYPHGVNMFPGAPPESLQIVCEWNGTDIVCRLPR
ncbi:hypothetical protein AWW74_12675 [Streptococcus pneumoniae]|nr:hypothetical protein AWW74_12675 [Streptococcus pneumoniae]